MTRSNNDADGSDEMNEDIEIIDESSATPPPGAESGLENQIQELKKEKLYLMADFDNFRKQAIKERSDLIKYGSEPIIREFLTILDNLERAASTEMTAETMTNYKTGVEMIVSQFKKILERFGVEEIESKGQAFDPNLHEALSSESNPDFADNTVSQVLSKAYKLRGKVIRPAQVVVNTKKEE